MAFETLPKKHTENTDKKREHSSWWLEFKKFFKYREDIQDLITKRESEIARPEWTEEERKKFDKARNEFRRWNKKGKKKQDKILEKLEFAEDDRVFEGGKNSLFLEREEETLSSLLRWNSILTVLEREAKAEFTPLTMEEKKGDEVPIILTPSIENDMQMDTSRRGWLKYWKHRFIQNPEIFPEKIQKNFQKLVDGSAESNDYDAIQAHFSKREELLKKKKVRSEFAQGRVHIMEELHQRMRDIDARVNYSEDELRHRYIVTYDDITKELFVLENGNKRKISYGDIVADYEWGIQYAPDESCPPQMWRKIRKLSDITEARGKIEQSVNTELVILKPSTSMSVRYQFTVQNLEEFSSHLNRKERRGFEGIMAEHMILSFLTRFQHNNPALQFRVEPANILEDTKLKYDFRVVVTQKNRGVAVEGEELPREEYVVERKRLGLQFTISKSGKKFREKEKFIKNVDVAELSKKYGKFIKRPVDEIVMISVPFDSYFTNFRKWIDAGKPPGGPEQLFTKEEKTTILKKILEPYYQFTDKELESLVF